MFHWTCVDGQTEGRADRQTDDGATKHVISPAHSSRSIINNIVACQLFGVSRFSSSGHPEQCRSFLLCLYMIAQLEIMLKVQCYFLIEHFPGGMYSSGVKKVKMPMNSSNANMIYSMQNVR